MNNIKYILIVVILAAIVGGGIIFYTKSQKESTKIIEVAPDETVDWKTYKAEDSGCEIKYPKDWIAKGTGKGFLALFYPKEESEIIFSIRGHGLTMNEETKCVPLFLREIGLRIVGKEIINGLKFCKMFYEHEGDIIEIYYNAIKENDKIGDIGETVCDIGFYYSGYYQGEDPYLSEEKNEAQLKILRQILSTFRSLE